MDLTGALGDLGTFLPIAFGLILINKVNPINVFLTAGVLYITAGIYFRIPMPVQPLKATSALAIALGASASTLSFVCFFMTLTLCVIRLLNFDALIARLFTRPIIRGIQLGLAFILIKSGLHLIFGSSSYNVFFGNNGSLNLYQAFFILFLPQLPLTLANSIYATADTSKTYFKDKAHRVTPRALLVSLSIANLLSGLFGGIPLCHGSSGVTAHYRFGARSGLCSICAGIFFIMLSLVFRFGGGVIIKSIPFWILGISLIYIGIRHAALIKDIVFFPREIMTAVIIGVYSFVSGNLALAFCIGIMVNFATNSIVMYGRRFRALRLEHSVCLPVRQTGLIGRQVWFPTGHKAMAWLFMAKASRRR